MIYDAPWNGYSERISKNVSLRSGTSLVTTLSGVTAGPPQQASPPPPPPLPQPLLAVFYITVMTLLKSVFPFNSSLKHMISTLYS